MAKLITGEIVSREDLKKFLSENGEFLRNRPMMVDSLREGRKAFFEKFVPTDGFSVKESFVELEEARKSQINANLEKCGLDYAIKKMEETKDSKIKKMLLMGMVLCVGDKIAKEQKYVDEMKIKKLREEGVL